MFEKMFRQNYQDIIKTMIKYNGVHTNNNYAIKWASKNGHLDLVKKLIEHGADIHADDDYAVRLASKNGHLCVVKKLIKYGANIHAENDFSIVWASANKYFDIVELLTSNF